MHAPLADAGAAPPSSLKAMSNPAYEDLQPPGLAPSRFRGQVEGEFRTWYYTLQMQRAQVSLGLAQGLVFLSVALDLIGAPGTPERVAALAKLMIISPALLVTMWISRQPRWRHLFPQFMCGTILCAGLAFSLVNIGGSGFGLSLRYDALVLVTVFTYFLGGLASNLACGTGLALLGLHIFMSSSREIPLEQMAYESLFLLVVNAVGMLSANMNEQSVREAFWRYQTMTQLSELDALTKLLNRRGFDRRYAELWERAQREQRPVAAAFIDIDHFKGINDRYGHQAGDFALKQIAQVLGQDIQPRPTLTARMGGDEFVAIWYDLSPDAAKGLAEQIPLAVKALHIRGETGEPDSVLSVSVGFSVCQPDVVALAGDCMRRADTALYEAKQAGRDRATVASTAP